jgi:hypothetical protein
VDSCCLCCWFYGRYFCYYRPRQPPALEHMIFSKVTTASIDSSCYKLEMQSIPHAEPINGVNDLRAATFQPYSVAAGPTDFAGPGGK